MIATEYAPLARRTLKELPRNQHIIHMALGLCGELGEFIDAVKKFVIYGKPLDLTNLTEEAGDEFWYIGNLLPEFDVKPEVLQRAIDEGYTQGTKLVVEQADPWEHAKILLQVNLSIATVSAASACNPDKFLPGSSAAVQAIEALGVGVGLLCGIYRLDPTQAMDLNIKKLAARYGDKYSDVAALNRNLDAERSVLEGGAANDTVAGDAVVAEAKPVVVEYTYSFDDLVNMGRSQGATGMGPNNMPGSFKCGGHPVTHENDNCYLVGGDATPMWRGQTLALNSDGTYTVSGEKAAE